MIIGPSIYSKDPIWRPEGIALTLPKIFFEDRGHSPAEFEKYFKRFMAKEDAYWNFKLKNLPTIEVPYVYLIFDGMFQCRCNFMQYQRKAAKQFQDAPDGKIRRFDENHNWVLFTGPVVGAPEGWVQKGFQGFRYTIKLF